MTESVVVLGSGYAGAGAIQSLEARTGRGVDITWISDVDHHLVLHEVHRCIRDPSVRHKVTVPVEEIASPSTTFRQGTVVDVEVDDRLVHLASGGSVGYDYLLVALGTETAFFGIDGLEEHAYTLKGLEDALDIHDAVVDATEGASPADPARVVVGGAGLSGIQVAGEVAEYSREHGAPIDVHLVEGLDHILPESDPQLQGALRQRLEDRDVDIHTGEFVGAVDGDRVYVGDDATIDYDVLVWTGGITGREAVRDAEIAKDERNHRIYANETFETDDERVFAIGDCALIDQPGGPTAPPTAQAAWQAAEVIGENVARRMRGQPLVGWTHEDKGTVVSVGESAVAYEVMYSPIALIGGTPAKLLKKAIAARWLADIAGIRRAIDAWPDM
ncbi:MAG: NAD(P)/FAD-dependent oxidoreductase [Halorientalis sp.]